MRFVSLLPLLTADVEEGLGIWALVVFLGALLGAILAVAVLMPMSRSFRQELRYVDSKIHSSQSKSERAYWEKRKRNLWLSLLPFVTYKRHRHHHHHRDD